jgi:hypothetical protein
MSEGSVDVHDFDGVFSSVGFYTQVNYDQMHELGDISWADETYCGVHIPKTPCDLKGTHVAHVCFTRPHEEGVTIAQSIDLARKFGFRPAFHHEVATTIRVASKEEIQALFGHVDRQHQNRRTRTVPAMSVACLGSSVAGETGDLTPVRQINRFTNHLGQLQLLKLHLGAAVLPAQVLAFVR